MDSEISILKGVHPGIVLDRELKKRKLPKGKFAMSINEYPQTLGAITKGKRSMNTPLALRIEHALGLEEGFLMTLQVFFEIKEEKRRQQHVLQGGIPKLRKILFWDTDFEKIDWIQQKKAIIKRVFERGNDLEKQELKRFYGEGVVSEVLSTENTKS